jgi:hypothetical protein
LLRRRTGVSEKLGKLKHLIPIGVSQVAACEKELRCTPRGLNRWPGRFGEVRDRLRVDTRELLQRRLRNASAAVLHRRQRSHRHAEVLSDELLRQAEILTRHAKSGADLRVFSPWFPLRRLAWSHGLAPKLPMDAPLFYDPD